ncbi:MAG: adenine phosphoribosyltransferase [Lactobacillaceae bacterium]|jgi:adenine phosphoribosyltransferase|nr:adenine phosphoribosyltransferase [Lactobacillaceae bacterium]
MNECDVADIVGKRIRSIPDFPKKGILFKDITTAIKDSDTFNLIIDWFVEKLKDKNVDYVVGLESRGFIFAPTVAYKLNAGFIPIRKPGKLPHDVERESYELEYGSDVIEIHKDAIEKGKRVAIIDDLLATGGTAAAAYSLIKKLGGNVVSVDFLLELTELKGRDKLPKDVEILALVLY